MSLQTAYELSETINAMTNTLVTNLSKHNPGVSVTPKIGLSNLNLDAAIIESKLGHLRALLCENI